MAFPQEFLDELTARNDILDVVSSYVHLTKKGNNYFGLCPFHSEKTGSFSVSPDKQIYYCFGCKRGGGVINFIMEEENLSFPDAVRFLAKRAGMDVPEEELVKRILLRGKESGRADDASEDIIRNRIAVYRDQTAVVADHYNRQGKYEAVNGVGNMDEVFDRICEVIDRYNK